MSPLKTKIKRAYKANLNQMSIIIVMLFILVLKKKDKSTYISFIFVTHFFRENDIGSNSHLTSKQKIT